MSKRGAIEAQRLSNPTPYPDPNPNPNPSPNPSPNPNPNQAQRLSSLGGISTVGPDSNPNPDPNPNILALTLTLTLARTLTLTRSILGGRGERASVLQAATIDANAASASEGRSERGLADRHPRWHLHQGGPLRLKGDPGQCSGLPRLPSRQGGHTG